MIMMAYKKCASYTLPLVALPCLPVTKLEKASCKNGEHSFFLPKVLCNPTTLLSWYAGSYVIDDSRHEKEGQANGLIAPPSYIMAIIEQHYRILIGFL